MKRLNAAHAARDLHAMLKMEIEWITQEGTDASRLSDEKLAVYNSVLEEQVDFGITSLPATASELAAHPTTVRVRYAPIDLTAVTVVHNLRNPSTGQPISDLVLSPRLVARIVSDSRLDTFYADPELRELNPGVRWPAFAPSQPLVRAEANADTALLTAWLQADPAARAFLDGADPRVWHASWFVFTSAASPRRC